MLDLGAIDDSDETWINGYPVGKDGTFPDDPGGLRRRRYRHAAAHIAEILPQIDSLTL